MAKQVASTKIKVEVTLQIDRSTIAGLIVCAFEGGSNYWYRIEGERGANNYEDRALSNEGIPISDFFGVDGDEKKMKTRKLCMNTIRHGLLTMAQKFPSHFADVVSDNCDAATGDVFLQCCLFGDTIYG